MTDDAQIRAKLLANLRAITDLADQLEDRAIDLADHPLMPGGEATANLAGCASFEGWAWRNDYRERQGLYDDGVEDPEQLWLPIQRLWFWSEAWRNEHDQPTDLRPTAQTEAFFLTDIIDWIIRNEPHLDDFVRDVHRAKVQLEDTLFAGERATRSRVRCEECEDKPRLVKVWARPPRADGWKCPACRTEYGADEHARAQHRQVWQPEAARWVTATEATHILANMTPPLRKPAAAKLMADPEVGTKTVGRRTAYWLPDLIRIHKLNTASHQIG